MKNYPKEITEFINKVQDRKSYLESELKCKILDRYNYVVVSTDFDHCIKEKDGHTDVAVVCALTEPVHLTEKLAHTIAENDIAFKGGDLKIQIEWTTLPVRDYYRKQLEICDSILRSFE